ncbi:MAG: penicillin-binding protein 1C, partial [Burkholderiales bacterium]|nr:penicillin-binding protein 1C [Burkholderiales bacterium]
APTVDTRLMSEGAAFIVRDILENGGRPGAPFKDGGTRVAWKTGTSFGFRDAWAIGVTDRYTLGVWVGRPDGTPNPGFFGANTAAPLVKDLLAALDTSATGGAPRAAPASVSAQDICWPLGLAASATPAEHCRQRRPAWTLDGTAPPTLPDRLLPAGLLDTAWVYTAPPGKTHAHPSAVRLRPGCAAPTSPRQGTLQPIAYARWPTLLQPWVEAAQRSEVERLPWGPPCRNGTPTRTLRISGLEAGSVLRAVPGKADITVQLQALGTTEAVNWLLDGRLVGTTSRDARTLRLSLQGTGQHALTAMDAAGQYQQVTFSVQ